MYDHQKPVGEKGITELSERKYGYHQKGSLQWFSNRDNTEYLVIYKHIHITETRGWQAIRQWTGWTGLTPKAEPTAMQTEAPAVPLKHPQQAQVPPRHNHFKPLVHRARPQLDVADCWLALKVETGIGQHWQSLCICKSGEGIYSSVFFVILICALSWIIGSIGSFGLYLGFKYWWEFWHFRRHCAGELL